MQMKGITTGSAYLTNHKSYSRKKGTTMTRYTIDFEAWATVEAESVEEAFALAQGIINEIEDLVSNHMTLEEPLFMVVRDNGVTEEEED